MDMVSKSTSPGPGRPKLDAADLRSVQVIVRVRPSEYAALEAAADGRKYSSIQDFIRHWALKAAARANGRAGR